MGPGPGLGKGGMGPMPGGEIKWSSGQFNSFCATYSSIVNWIPCFYVFILVLNTYTLHYI